MKAPPSANAASPPASTGNFIHFQHRMRRGNWNSSRRSRRPSGGVEICFFSIRICNPMAEDESPSLKPISGAEGRPERPCAAQDRPPHGRTWARRGRPARRSSHSRAGNNSARKEQISTIRCQRSAHGFDVAGEDSVPTSDRRERRRCSEARRETRRSQRHPITARRRRKPDYAP